MQIAVLGAGAVGGFFGAKLAAASNNVAFMARGDHLAAMLHDGLFIESFERNLEIRGALFTDIPAAVGPVDLILFCVKSYDTEAAAQALAPMMGKETVVLSLQNGIDNADKIARLWGAQRTLAGVVYIGSQLCQPGRIRHSAGGRIVFGELDGQIHESTRAVERVLASAQIPCEISTDIRQSQWRKLLWNAPFCAISCMTHATMKEILESESLIKLALDCMAEVREAAKSQGVDLDPSLFDETLNFSKSLGDFKPSMLQDLEGGKPLEFDAFNGTVATLLEQSGKAAPTNQVFYGVLKHLDQKIRARKPL
jgi:2-dehydropantoate 2-reductase